MLEPTRCQPQEWLFEGDQMRIAAHPNPIRRTSPIFMLRVPVDILDASDCYEQLWTKRLADDEFQVTCIPFFVYDIAYGDVLHADPSTGYALPSVVRHSGNGLLRVAVVNPDDVEYVHQIVHDLLERLGYLYEWHRPGYVAINLDAGRSHDPLTKPLEELGDKVQVERMLG
jgi:hypothetical protein